MNDGRLLTIRNLRVVYPGDDGDFRAVRNVSFSLGRERLGIVGESGSGKSTTGRAIMGLIPYPGRVEADEMRLGDTDLTALDERGFRRLRGKRIAMVLQDPKFSLDPVMTVGKQIAETHRYHFRSTKQCRPRRRAGDAPRRPHPRSRARLPPIRPPGFRRHGPAHHDRHDAHRRPRHPDRRRTHLRARRIGPAAGARHHGRDGEKPRHGPDPHQPQPASRLIVLRPRARHVRRPDRRGLRRRPAARSAAPLHQRSAHRPPRTRPPPRRSCRSCGAIPSG